MNNNSSKQILLSVLGVAILVVAVVGVSFAAFTFTQPGEKVNTITTGAITLVYNEGNGIKLTDAMPITDEQGKVLQDTNQYFDFNLAATIAGNTTINYAISAVKEEADSTLADTDVKLYLEKLSGAAVEASTAGTGVFGPKSFTKAGSVDTKTGRPADEMDLVTGTITKTETTYYRLRMWVASDAADTFETQKTYKVKVNVYAKAEEPAD